VHGRDEGISRLMRVKMKGLLRNFQLVKFYTSIYTRKENKIYSFGMDGKKIN
jgi:hypothetical protein